MPIEIKELQIRVQVPEPNEETALGSPVQIHVDASDNLWIGPGETTPDDLFGTDAGVPDHDSWIDVDATILGGHKSGSDAAGGNLELTVKVLDGASQTGHYTQIIWGETAASAGEVLDAGAGELPASTQGRGLFVLSTAPLSGHTGGANMLLADGHVTFDPAEFFAADDSAAASPTGHYTQMIWAETRSSDVQPNPPSWGIDRVDQRASFMGGVSVEASDAAPGGRLFLATEVGVYAGGGLNDWRSNYGTGGGAAASDGGGDDILIGGDSANGGLSHGKASFQDLSVIIPASEGGLGVNTVLLDGSIRTVGPQDAGETSAAEASGPMKESMETMKKAWMDASATPEASPVTEHTSGLTYSGESGGLNESQTVPTRPMSWDNVANKPAVEPYGHVDASGAIWGLDRIDMLDDAAAPFFAYDVGFRGGVDVSGSHTGALRNISGDAMPAAAGDNMQTYLEIELTDALLSSYASGKASEDDFAAVPADTGNHLGNTYTGMTVINDGVLQQDMTLSFSYSLV